ncbi:izumo sperm-egg fusion protein 1-like [Suricata suricatta]|uniref:Immunoglobulin domain-containing protein n=1 Tax=Suricata suricatta TaxID=37032 RepID=A0A673V750_SURSU|nr:izumo sperm-egg fusion protein 1-like [Suricata suricatta]
MSPPQLALLVAALAYGLLPAGGCIICDPRIVAALDSLDTEYLSTHMAPERRRKVMETIRQTVRNFKDLPDLQPRFMGVIDEATMNTAVMSFLRSVKPIINSGLTGDSFMREFSWMLTLEKEAFQHYIDQFQKEDLCPNKCGTMLQRLLWCNNCVQDNYICRKSRDCGVRQVNVHEKEDMILDCELNWHKLSQGLTSYSFYRVWGSNSETLVYKGRRPTLTKPLVGPEDAGTYRCELGTVRSGPATIIHFQVTVLPQRIIAKTMPMSSTFATRAKAEEEIGVDLSPTQEPSECSKPESVQRGRLIGLLIWCFLLLIIGFVTGVLFFRYGMMVDSINSWFGTDKAAAAQD